MPNFFVTSAKGLHVLVENELKQIFERTSKPYRILDSSVAGLSFEGELEHGYLVCLHSRLASRILLKLGRVPAGDARKLYAGIKSIRWSDHLGPKQTIAVDFKGVNAELKNSQFSAQKVKDAICDQLVSVQGARPSVDLEQPDIRVNAYLPPIVIGRAAGEAEISLDFSGDSLHIRGYRQRQNQAPLKETLAAAILNLSGWDDLCASAEASEHVLYDPMTGSGTLPIEAALVATRTAPGTLRGRFGFTRWRGHDSALWERLRAEAVAERIDDPMKLPKFFGYDSDQQAIQIARENADRAGVGKLIEFGRRELARTERPKRKVAPMRMKDAEKGLFVVNPPYGERLGDEEALKPLYRQIGDVMKQCFSGWNGAVFTGSVALSKEVGLKADRKDTLYNGKIECKLMHYSLYPRRTETAPESQ